VVVEVAVVVVERFAVVGVERDDGLVQNAARLQGREEGLDAGVHVGDGPVVLGDDVVLVRDSGGIHEAKKSRNGLNSMTGCMDLFFGSHSLPP
jgi:hypothetical protein